MTGWTDLAVWAVIAIAFVVGAVTGAAAVLRYVDR